MVALVGLGEYDLVVAINIENSSERRYEFDRFNGMLDLKPDLHSLDNVLRQTDGSRGVASVDAEDDSYAHGL